MATQEAKAKNTPEPIKPPEGFEQGGRPDVDGWFKPEKGAIIYGKISGYMKIKGDNGLRDIIVVKVRQPTEAYLKGGDKVTLEKGQFLGVTVSTDLRDALMYVENKGEIYAVAKEKKKLTGSRTLWKYDQYYKGEKAPLQASDSIEANTDVGDDDDIPF